MGHEGVDTNWDLSPVSSTVSMLSHRGEFNKKKTNAFGTKTYLPEQVRIRQMTNIRIRLLINKRQMMVI